MANVMLAVAERSPLAEGLAGIADDEENKPVAPDLLRKGDFDKLDCCTEPDGSEDAAS